MLDQRWHYDYTNVTEPAMLDQRWRYDYQRHRAGDAGSALAP